MRELHPARAELEQAEDDRQREPPRASPSLIYDVAYCARGRSENFIKELKNALHADRLSCHRFVANAFRLMLLAIAYRLMHALRATVARVAPATEDVSTDRVRLATAQMDTLRLRLLEVAAHVTAAVRRVLMHSAIL